MKVRFTLVLACAFVLALPVAASAHPMPANTLATAFGIGAASTFRGGGG